MRPVATSWIRRAIALSGASLALAGCAAPTEPVRAEAEEPAAVTDAALSAARPSGAVVVW